MLGDLAYIARTIQGKIYGHGPIREVERVSIDTRTLTPGSLFFALKGERFDGHDFLKQAWDKGAIGVVVEKGELAKEYAASQKTVILVEDTLKALQTLARSHREKLKIPVIGITGSNGKTTTKDMVAAVLEERYQVLKTQGNFNNEIGLPLTLLELKPFHEAAVLEMGMRGLKEIEALCQMARPNGGIITNIGVTHYELLGSVENIAKAKGELVESIPEQGFCLLNGEDRWSHRLSTLCRGKVLYYGFDANAQIRARELKNTEKGTAFILETEKGSTPVNLPLPGEHNVLNALAAAGVGLELGLGLSEIAQGLENVKLSAMRLALVPGKNESLIINDAYNANPTSTKASLKVLAERKKRRAIAVLGDMRELGSLEVVGHEEVGKHLVELSIDYLLTVGPLARHIAQGALQQGMDPTRVFSFDNNNDAKKFLAELLLPGDVVLVKGSRALQMEEIVDFVKDERRQLGHDE